MEANHMRDGGWASRKLHFSLLSAGLIFAGMCLGAHWAGVAAVYPEFVAGVLGVLSIFAGSNVATKWTFAKHADVLAKAQAIAGKVTEVLDKPKGDPKDEG